MTELDVAPFHSEENSLCWCCQQPLCGAAADRVWVTPDVSLPIHKSCWEKLSLEKRAEIAFACYKHHVPGEQIAGLIETLQNCLANGRGDFGDFISFN